MLKTGKYIMVLFLCVSLFESCKTSKIPAYYTFTPPQVKNGITGSWTKIVLYKSDTAAISELSGELIAIQPDTIYILTEQKLVAVSSRRIDECMLYIFANQSKAMGLITGLLFTPNIIAAISNSMSAYLGLGMPWFLTGMLSAIREGYNDSNLLVFPARNPLNDFKKYARFPNGLPTDIDRKRLHLIK